MFKNTTKTVAIISLIALSGCATKPEDIDAAYVSPLAYESYSCEQLGQEAQRVSQKASEAAGIQKQKAKSDAVAVGVSVVLFWPAIFFVKGKSANEGELARLKGEMETIEKVSIQKECGFDFQKDQTQSAQTTPQVENEPQIIEANPS